MTRKNELPIESSLELAPVVPEFFDRIADKETAAIMKSLFGVKRKVKVFDYCGDLPGGEEEG